MESEALKGDRATMNVHYTAATTVMNKKKKNQIEFKN